MWMYVFVCVDNGSITLTSSIIIADDFTSTTEPYTASLKRGRIHFCCEIDSLTHRSDFSLFSEISVYHCMPHCLFTIEWAHVRQTTAQIYKHMCMNNTVYEQQQLIRNERRKTKTEKCQGERKEKWHPHRFS